MRLNIALLALTSLLALPGSGSAQEQPPPPRPAPSADAPPPRAVAPPPRAEASPPRFEAPPREGEVRPAHPARPYSPYPRAGPRPGRPYAYPAPAPRPRYWWGWGWGWYPLYPYRPLPPPEQPIDERFAPPREQDRVYARFSLYGAGRSDGYMGGVTFGLEGRYVGFDADVAALAQEQVTGPLHSSRSDPATWATAHVTWSLVNDRSVRLRLETGVSILALPDSPFVADRPWRGNTLFGPDVGVSGQIGLVGPLGIEGHARLTPFPTRVADTFVGLAVHGGPLGVNAGWRWVDVAEHDHEQDAPHLMFRGPQVGLVVRF